MSLKNTRSEITYILTKLEGNKRIVIVDNASSNGSGMALNKQYADNPLIDVIINDRNLGFAKGMNIGYRRAAQYNPEFIVTMNNDLEFTQKNFIPLIYDSYLKFKFDVLGPSIFVPETKIHQNPKKRSAYTVQDVQIIHDKNVRILNSPKWLFSLRARIKKVNVLKKIVLDVRNRKNHDNNHMLKNVVLHGSMLIFSKTFIQNGIAPFAPDTFFYFETEILDKMIRKNGMISKFEPSIKMIHHQSSSTRETFDDAIKQQQFQVKNMIKSTNVFLQLFDK
ncbi:glycosyltransferase [Lapidilactobacillus wuchangensis]|uniref:glycosyltransferase n=1 Tax=Lapidilactobacillus wuchangensis TaxID=2486001 RepID=UPI0013DDCF77|nr:glycosyltransferase family 2 protein [Lapidilactobacillus wuchangensis]